MPNIDKGSLVMCLQALERSIEYNEYLAQSDTVDKDDYEEVNYRYELTLNKLAKIYREEYSRDNLLLPLEKIIKYQVVN